METEAVQSPRPVLIMPRTNISLDRPSSPVSSPRDISPVRRPKTGPATKPSSFVQNPLPSDNSTEDLSALSLVVNSSGHVSSPRVEPNSSSSFVEFDKSMRWSREQKLSPQRPPLWMIAINSHRSNELEEKGRWKSRVRPFLTRGRAKTLHNRHKIARKHVMDMIKQGEIRGRKEGMKSFGPPSGASDLRTIIESPDVIVAVSKLWCAMGLGDNMWLRKSSFITFFSRVLQALLPDSDELDTVKASSDDWISIVGAADEMSRRKFYECTFDVANAWMESRTTVEYVAFFVDILKSVYPEAHDDLKRAETEGRFPLPQDTILPERIEARPPELQRHDYRPRRKPRMKATVRSSSALVYISRGADVSRSSSGQREVPKRDSSGLRLGVGGMQVRGLQTTVRKVATAHARNRASSREPPSRVRPPQERLGNDPTAKGILRALSAGASWNDPSITGAVSRLGVDNMLGREDGVRILEQMLAAKVPAATVSNGATESRKAEVRGGANHERDSYSSWDADADKSLWGGQSSRKSGADSRRPRTATSTSRFPTDRKTVIAPNKTPRPMTAKDSIKLITRGAGGTPLTSWSPATPASVSPRVVEWGANDGGKQEGKNSSSGRLCSARLGQSVEQASVFPQYRERVLSSRQQRAFMKGAITIIAPQFNGPSRSERHSYGKGDVDKVESKSSRGKHFEVVVGPDGKPMEPHPPASEKKKRSRRSYNVPKEDRKAEKPEKVKVSYLAEKAVLAEIPALDLGSVHEREAEKGKNVTLKTDRAFGERNVNLQGFLTSRPTRGPTARSHKSVVRWYSRNTQRDAAEDNGLMELLHKMEKEIEKGTMIADRTIQNARPAHSEELIRQKMEEYSDTLSALPGKLKGRTFKSVRSRR